MVGFFLIPTIDVVTDVDFDLHIYVRVHVDFGTHISWEKQFCNKIKTKRKQNWHKNTLQILHRTNVNYCRTVDTTKATDIDSSESESDGDVDDDELLLAMQLSMTATSPKPSKSTVVDE